MRTMEEIFQNLNGFGAIKNNESITLTKNQIFEAMKEYAEQVEENAFVHGFNGGMGYIIGVHPEGEPRNYEEYKKLNPLK